MHQIGPVMLDLESTSLTKEESEKLKHPASGGVILFSRNIDTAEQVFELNKSIYQCNPNLILAVDQEGGRVQRLREGFSRLPSVRDIERQADSFEHALQLAFHHSRLMACEVLSVGFDISFSPVLDCASASSKVIGDRALHEDPKLISTLAKEYLKGMHSVGMASTAKHFPGHGSVDEDSHIELPVDSREFSDVEQKDLIPFVDLKDYYQAVMLAHIVYPNIDSLPAGFSEFWVKELLRNKMQYSGAILSDDLSMKGADIIGDYVDRANCSLDAGCDMVLVCNHPKEAGLVLESLESRKWKESSMRLNALKSTRKRAIGFDQMKNQCEIWQQSFRELSKTFSLKE